jgi:archaellin
MGENALVLFAYITVASSAVVFLSCAVFITWKDHSINTLDTVEVSDTVEVTDCEQQLPKYTER